MLDVVIFLFIENKYQEVNTEEASIARHYPPLIFRRPRECFLDSGCRIPWPRPDCCKGAPRLFVKIHGLCCSW